MGKISYDLIVSIGEDCAASLYLRKGGLQFKSYPFDWLTHASFQVRIELLLNNFNDFMSIDDMKFLPKNPAVINDSKCDYYENVRTGFYFYHDFTCGALLEESLPAVLKKYERRIKRLYECMQKAPKVLLVWLSHTKKQDDGALVELHDKVAAKFGKEINFLIIEHDPMKEPGEMVRETVGPGGITRYKLFTKAYDEAGRPTTLGNISGCSGVFCNYSLKEPVSARARRLLIKALRRVTPIKSWRERLKQVD